MHFYKSAKIYQEKFMDVSLYAEPFKVFFDVSRLLKTKWYFLFECYGGGRNNKTSCTTRNRYT